MTYLRVMAIDDEALALGRVALLVGRIAGAELVATSQEPLEALGLIERLRPDVLLLDIQMAGLGGIELVEQLVRAGSHLPQIVFVTAYNQHAVRAFEARAADYVLKPLQADRLAAALDRVRLLVERERASQRAEDLQRVLDALRAEARPPEPDEDAREIWVQSGGHHVRLLAGDIDWVESDRDYVHVHNRERGYMLRTTMAALHDRLGTDRYMRVRRSALVRVDRVAAIRDRGYGNVDVVLHSGVEVRVGRTYLKPLRDRLRASDLG